MHLMFHSSPSSSAAKIHFIIKDNSDQKLDILRNNTRTISNIARLT